jgi:5-methylcytosine-specific restriction enzyme B
VARYNSHHESGPIYAAAEVWRDRCLVADGSILQDGLNLWTPGLVDELDTRFVQNLDEGDGDFFEKLKSQLGGGSPECRQLMAEVLWILMLFQSNIGAAKKRENVRAVWSWSGNQLPEDHPMLSDAVLDGLGSAGTAYNTHRWREISFLIAALRDLKGRGELGRAALLQDGWAFAEWLSKQNGARNRQLPHILTHLVFPDTFERISSAGEKRAILAAFGEVSDKELRKWDFTPIDKALLDLRHRFEEERGGDIDFYEKEFTKDWRASIGTWLLSWNPTKWEWATLKQDRAKTIVGQAATHAWRCASTLPREGDHVYLARTGVEPKGIVAFGTVARASYDAPHYDSTRAKAGETSRFIDVDFSEVRDAAEDQIVSLDLLQQKAPEQTWNPQSSGIEIKPKAARALARLWNSSSTKPAIVDATSKIQFSQVVDSGEPLNLILYGPPGTGKTYRLQQHHIPLYTSDNGNRYEFITFHQSYSYEDFVEGIRPETHSGGIAYEVRPGVLRTLCERARKDPRRRYALFIDEINRGNIAKVFGELITLVEEDKRLRFNDRGEKISGLEVTLPYSGSLFGVPANVDLIGTMNTADRSIALLDSALRRRFQFEEMMPLSGTIKGVRDGLVYDEDGGEIDLRRLLDVLNARLTHLLHRDQTIGHAYLTKVRDFAGLRRVMAREILPLLQEYFYDDWRQIRLVLSDNSIEPAYQIVRQKVFKSEQLFPGSEAADIGESVVFEVATEASISGDSIRKIYEPR